MSDFDIAVSIALGVGLAAAVGFRVLLPLLVMSVAAYTGHLALDDGFAWLATPTALAMLSVAALVEILAYYVPGVDNLLDTIATPATVVAGTIAAAAVMTDLPPIVKWTTAVIAGGGVAGLTQSVTSLLRAKSTLSCRQTTCRRAPWKRNSTIARGWSSTPRAPPRWRGCARGSMRSPISRRCLS